MGPYSLSLRGKVRSFPRIAIKRTGFELERKLWNFVCTSSYSDVTGWTIQLGITRRHSHTYLGQKLKVKRVVPHPEYNLGFAQDNDVALFQVFNN